MMSASSEDVSNLIVERIDLIDEVMKNKVKTKEPINTTW